MQTIATQRICILMFSGGLDSVVAAHLLKGLGLDVQGLHFVLPFEAGLGRTHAVVRGRAERIGMPLTVIEEREEFLAVLTSPSFGFGKHANPCVDCRIHRLQAAKRVMEERGASFVATGEVLGQRPMSQQRNTLRAIEKRCGLDGFLLRPLSAQLLPETVPEKEGWVERSKLLAIRGRGRKEQLAYAARHGLEYGSPAGGCILTNEASARRFEDLVKHSPGYSFDDLRLIAYGRRFRLSSDLVLVVGRNEHENGVLERVRLPGDRRLELADFAGPVALARGPATEEELRRCAAITARYAGQAQGSSRVRVTVSEGDGQRVVDVAPATDSECEAVRV